MNLPFSRPLLLAACMLLAPGAFAAPQGGDWGNTLYVGDSITHGFHYESYRWPLFKILADNGITQQEIGIHSGFVGLGNVTGLRYGKACFANLHAAQTGITAAQVAGAGRGKLDGSGITQWLGLDSSYTGSCRVHAANLSATLARPDTVLIMLGTNDIFGRVLRESNAQDVANTLLHYLDTITRALRRANSRADIVLASLPTWSEARTGNMGGASNYKALATCNEVLEGWAGQQGITFININRGLINLSNTSKPGAGVAELFRDRAHGRETQHPNAQGDLIIASNIAQQLGYAGRTAGQQRKARSGFSQQEGLLELASGATLCRDWGAGEDLSCGFTAEFGLVSPGAGEDLSLNVGDGTQSGTLRLSHRLLYWGENILCSVSPTDLSCPLRIAFIHGDPAQNLEDGFYVWLGDRLIGEALSGTGREKGLCLSNGGTASVLFSHLSRAAGAWAPPSAGLSFGNPLIAPATDLPDAEVTLTGARLGNAASGHALAIRNQSGIASGHNARITVNGGTLITPWLVASHGNYTGKVQVALSGSLHKSDKGLYNAAQYTGTLEGDLSFTLAEGFRTTGEPCWAPFIGAENATLCGNLSMEFSARELHVAANNTRPCAIAACNGSDISGAVRVCINAGHFRGNIYGGSLSNHHIGGGTQVVLNGGSVGGCIYGGGSQGSISAPADGSAPGSSVTIAGAATISGQVCAGGSGGIIRGGTLLTVRNASPQSPFAHYSGTLCGKGTGKVEGTRTLCLERVGPLTLKARLQNFDALRLCGNSDVRLSQLGGASHLTIEEGSCLTLTAGRHRLRVQNFGSVAVQKGASLELDATNMDGNISGRYELNGGHLNIGAYDHLDTPVTITSGSLSKGGTLLNGQVHIRAEGDVKLHGVEAAEIAALHTRSGVQVQGLSGRLSLPEVMLSLDEASQSPERVALVFREGGLRTERLTLRLRADLCRKLLSSPESAPLKLLVCKGELKANAIHLSMAAEYEGSPLTASGIETSPEGYSYVLLRVLLGD